MLEIVEITNKFGLKMDNNWEKVISVLGNGGEVSNEEVKILKKRGRLC